MVRTTSSESATTLARALLVGLALVVAATAGPGSVVGSHQDPGRNEPVEPGDILYTDSFDANPWLSHEVSDTDGLTKWHLIEKETLDDAYDSLGFAGPYEGDSFIHVGYMMDDGVEPLPSPSPTKENVAPYGYGNLVDLTIQSGKICIPFGSTNPILSLMVAGSSHYRDKLYIQFEEHDSQRGIVTLHSISTEDEEGLLDPQPQYEEHVIPMGHLPFATDPFSTKCFFLHFYFHSTPLVNAGVGWSVDDMVIYEGS